jgi:hypothetical protein
MPLAPEALFSSRERSPLTFDLSCAKIIKALAEKEGDMVELRDYHAGRLVDLTRQELQLKGVFGMTLESNPKGKQARASQTSQLRSKMLPEP